MRCVCNSLLSVFALLLTAGCTWDSGELLQEAGLANPYDRVDWATFSHYRADLHVHTTQSDGCHHPEEVVRIFHEAGFSILSITDHDAVAPNFCPMRESDSPYPDPKPPNFPANTTWPWSDFGAPSPTELGMLGIEGSEMTCGHHRSSFFTDFGMLTDCGVSINDQLHEVARRDGLVFINHPETRFKEWYVEFMQYHPADYLVGIEISRDFEKTATVWDQMLGDLMPSRPVWGFANSDMHLFAQTPFAFTVFLLDELTTENVKDAIKAGQFYSVVGPGMMDLREVGRAAYDGTYPELRSISVQPDLGEIAIEAVNYDEIVWISGTATWIYNMDPETGSPWPPGEIVHRGDTFRSSSIDRELRYVRAELIRHSEEGPVRLILNPFALTDQ